MIICKIQELYKAKTSFQLVRIDYLDTGFLGSSVKFFSFTFFIFSVLGDIKWLVFFIINIYKPRV